VTLTGRRERVRGVALAVCDDGVAATSSAECGRRAVAAVHGHPCISRTSPTSYVVWRAASRERRQSVGPGTHTLF
jgi:hypothetical protein